MQKYIAAAGLAAGALLIAAALALGAEQNPSIGVYPLDNIPGITIGTGSPYGAAVVANPNGVAINGAASGSAPTIAVGGGYAGQADTNQNLSVAGAGTGLVLLGQSICTVTGASPQTCNGQRGIVTTGTLSTAALTNAAYTINDNSVTASSLVVCTDEGYSGTLVTNGEPVIMTCVPGSGTITVNITNVHSANALNGTVKIGFAVLN